MSKIIFPTALKLTDPANVPRAGKAIGELQSMLLKLKFNVQPSDLARKEMGASTQEAVRSFQTKAGLQADGNLTPDTVAKLNAELAHQYVAQSKTRTQRLQELLLQAGQQVTAEEVNNRKFGLSTERALKAAQAKLGMTQDGRISEELVDKLREESVKAKLGTKAQVAQIQRTLLRALSIAKMAEIRIAADELKGKTIGSSTLAAIQAIQGKYGLPATDQLDADTLDRLTSIAKSIPEPSRQLKASSAAELKLVRKSARLNMQSAHVGEVQKALAFLGFKVNESEYKDQIFGKSTRDALVSYQQARGLAVTGHAAGDTLASLNREIQRVNPAVAEGEFPYRIRGSVRNERWHGMSDITVQVWDKPVSGQAVKLAERKTGANGFFDIRYDPPRETTTKQIKQSYHLQIKAVEAGNQEIGSKLLFNPTQIAWANFTKGDHPYRGTSQFQARMAAIAKATGNTRVADLVETAADRQISRVAQAARLMDEDVMRLVLAHRVAADVNQASIGAEACYAFLAQNLPPSLPGDLLNSTEDWNQIADLVDLAANGLVFMDDDLKSMAFDNAISQNLISISVGLKKDTVLAAFSQVKQTYALEKPVLSGNGNLKGLLEESTVNKAHHTAVAAALLKFKSFGPEFWDDVNGRPADFGGTDALKDLRATVEIGHVTNNFAPMLRVLKQKIADPNDGRFNSARDLAKMPHDEWISLINANGQDVPLETPGQTLDEQVTNYAATLAELSEKMFPEVALVATVARSGNNPLPNVGGVQDLLDKHPDFDFKNGNIDVFIKQKTINADKDTLTTGRVLQRVHRIAPTALSGQVLLDNKIHSSAQIVAMGKDKFVSTITKDNKVDSRMALTIYGRAEHRYAQVLQRIADYRFDLHRADPKAIIDHTYKKADLPEELADIPDLETLFGSLDFCACDHCQSVYGPAAYLADVLRFLDKHDSEDDDPAHPGKKISVQALLFERRPDIGNILLNCQNSETGLPYIDLVCEILESAVAAPNPAADFHFQTTKTSVELRAAPRHVRLDAYEKLRTADYPLNISFDLWQEQARVFLQHLGVARWELMEAYQSIHQPKPTDASIAAEYWGISSHEAALIVAAGSNTVDLQKTYWGIKSDVIPNGMSVADFLRRSFISYDELLELLALPWINPKGDLHNVVIERPEATCDTELQKIVHLNVDRLDKMHRFLRLQRHLGWSMWEIDLLLRSDAIGNGNLDEDCLVRMRQFEKLQRRLGLSVEQGLALFADINTEVRVKPDRPKENIPSLYENLFQNQAVASPIDAAFALPITGGHHLQDDSPDRDHRRTVLAAFALTADDLERLRPGLPNNDLSLSNLSKIGRYAWLAKGLGISVKVLLALETLLGAGNIFSAPEDTLSFIEGFDWVTHSTFSVDELDYLLGINPDSPIGLREDAITRYIDALRQALRADRTTNQAGVIASLIATTFDVAVDQARLLLGQTAVGGGTYSELLQDPQLVELDENGNFALELTTSNFPSVHLAYCYLHKATLLVKKFALNTADLEWLLAKGEAFGLLHPNSLPVENQPDSPLFPDWLKLSKWAHVKGLYPEPEGISLRRVLDLAGVQATPVEDIKAAISNLTQWGISEVDQLVDALSLQNDAGNSDFARVDSYLQLDKCRRLAQRLGIAPAKASAWADREAMQALAAQEIRQTTKSKYDDAVWLQKVAPLEDTLREKKRDALISYLVAGSDVWRDGNDLLKYFLIDVEMGTCQLTSRIKQAISSTQMFVQRCLLGLERPRIDVSRLEQQDTVSENSWKQWQWMKSYRTWEANRKVFLYPENWIEPELRDDKSPFFKELESELLQSDMTDENAEQAFLHYVQKVHEVARLDIVGIYFEVDEQDALRNIDDLDPEAQIMHVIGRTRAQPAIYYYRKYDGSNERWGAWEKIDLDIQSDQVIPVVYNRQLHLFWLSFMEKPQKVKKLPPAKPSDNPVDSPEPPNQLEIQLCWSTQKRDGWTAKKVSHQKLFHPWQRPFHSYNLKPRYKSRENLLWLDVYISQSQEFNGTQFYDSYGRDTVVQFPFGPKVTFKTFNAFMTNRHPYDETARPWHSSSFVFDGDVIDVKMKALAGQYRIQQAGTSGDLRQTTSLAFVQNQFGEAGRAVKELGEDKTQDSRRYEIGPRLPLPDGMRYRNTRLVNNSRNGSRVNVLENDHTRTLLSGATSPFEIISSQHSIVFDTVKWGMIPFFYQDKARTFFIKPEKRRFDIGPRINNGLKLTLQTLRYSFFPFYHPYSALFMRELKRSGLDGLLNRRIQTQPESYYPGNSYGFDGYNPASVSLPDKTALSDRVDYEPYGAYALYNWEIFFHAPLMIACKLSQNQRFEEAMRWFHYIFDPTNTESSEVPQRYWVTRPFFEQNSDAYRQQRIDNLLKNIEQHEGELQAWKNNPFKPHLIARYRPVAYQKTVVMKYIDNLIAWGDQLFRRDTIEAINEATTLYVLAYELLGRRPVKVPNVEHADKSYNDLVAEGGLDPFGNKQVDILMENFTQSPVRVTRSQSGTEPLPTLNVFYFGIPNNDRLLTYWDTIEDRLFKIRHCMNIEGVFRQLPLFEPPIDPALLVKAAAAGVDLSSASVDLSVPPAPYRFRQISQKALEFCAEVKALGDKLLAVLEKGDAEGLSLLRSSQEIALQKAVREIKRLQINEANESWASLEKSKELAQQKRDFYQGRDFMNPWEITAIGLNGASALIQGSIAVGYVLAGGLALIPNISAGVSGFGGTPQITTETPVGRKLSEGAGHAMNTLNAIMSTLDRTGAMAATVGGYWRRKDEWDFQGQLATTEIVQIEKQIASAQIRLAISERDLENQERQIDQSQAVDEYMRTKYTNQQLFDWQARQVATLYFQSYQLAFDMAKRAEKCFRHERGDSAATFIQFGYWDSLKKGLLAGERLASDIRRMEAAYFEQNSRDLEISKHISLADYFPLSLIALKETGACTIILPEWLFDLDYPGHYFRRIKSVSISIPCVVGPYTSVNCTLTLTKADVRRTDAVAGYRELVPVSAPSIPTSRIATSHGQNDSGMFELNFNDERFLPFEGAGVVSEWRLELPRENNQFDFSTLADVILHVRYTARASGDISLAQAAKNNLASVLPPLGIKMLVLNQAFSTEWQRFLHPAAGQEQELKFKIGMEHLPFYVRGKTNVNVSKVTLIVEGAVKVDGTGESYTVEVIFPGNAPVQDISMEPDVAYGGRQILTLDGFVQRHHVVGDWKFKIRRAGAANFTSLPTDDLKNAYLVLGFRTS